MQPCRRLKPERPLRERRAELRARHPLPPPTGPKADKAFFDDLSGDRPADEAIFVDASALIAMTESELAVEADERFGKGRHPAGLNMGDRHAYACARANGARLLFEGSDCARTDVPQA